MTNLFYIWLWVFCRFLLLLFVYFISMNWITLKLQYTRIISSKNIIVFVDDMEKIWGTVAAISFPFHFCYRVCQFCLDRGNLICSILAWHSFVCACVGFKRVSSLYCMFHLNPNLKVIIFSSLINIIISVIRLKSWLCTFLMIIPWSFFIIVIQMYLNILLLKHNYYYYLPQRNLKLPYKIANMSTWKLKCVPVTQWLEHCVSSAKVVGSILKEHTYWQYKYIACKSLWIKASNKCVNEINN